MDNNKVLEKNSHKKYYCEYGKNIFVLFAVVLRFVFSIKLNIDVNFATHLNFVLMEEESQVVRIVVEEITVNTANRKSSA